MPDGKIDYLPSAKRQKAVESMVEQSIKDKKIEPANRASMIEGCK